MRLALWRVPCIVLLFVVSCVYRTYHDRIFDCPTLSLLSSLTLTPYPPPPPSHVPHGYYCFRFHISPARCGEYSVTLCGDPGCYDPGTGDYDVVVPADQPLGEYKLQVKCNDDETSHCSYLTFYVIEAGGDIPTLSPSLTPLETPSPVEPRTASPNVPTDAPVAPTASPNAPTTAPNAPTTSPNAPTTSPNAPTGSPNVPTGGPTAPTAGGPSPPTETPTSPAVAPTPPDDSSLGEPGSPGTPPTPVPAKVECDATAELEFVYMQENTKLPLITVSHASGDREEAGCLTLTKLYNWLATAPEGVPEVN